MTAGDKQVIARYEDLQMSVEDIALDLGLDQAAVRMSLAQHSAAYRVELRSGRGNEQAMFEDFVMNKAKRVMGELLTSEDSQTQFRAAKFIIDENTGRNNAAVRGLAATRQLGISVNELNEALRRARQQRVRPAQIIDVPAAIETPKISEKVLDNEMVLAK